ncbi:TRAP transporter small permease [Pararhodobacter sp. SW119]|uniref:TRAP transporter small permease n=1 Tax=Pararhodobacter sp. SW119 TaxID=2780075 RepID=UPI001ADEC92D|nr:TRAP transporter small permease [Pararhodobacter sp. SW119]
MIDRIETALARAMELAAMAMMAALIGVIAWSVLARQVLRISVAWSEEVGSGLLMWMALLGAAAVWARRGHIVIDVLPRRLPPRPRWVLAIGVELAALLLFAVIVWGAASMMQVSANNHTTALGISLSWLYLALVVGVGAMAMFSVLHIVRLLMRGPAMLEDGWNTSSSSSD